MQLAGIEELVRAWFKKKGLPRGYAVTFPDVVIIDETSTIEHRGDISDLKTRLARDIFLNIPIVSANMSTVTESRMAIALARRGGIGFIHQALKLEKRIEEVLKVKRADNEVIENPWSISEKISAAEAVKFMRDKKTSGVLVIDEGGRLVGILTDRDVRFLFLNPHDEALSVAELIRPAKKLVTASPEISIDEAIGILHTERIEKLPLVDYEGRPVGLITSRDILKRYEFPCAVRDKKGRLLVGATVGIGENAVSETEELLFAGADIILVDTARGNSISAAQTVQKIRKILKDIPLVAGNVDTSRGAKLLIDAGADCVKVGIGPGSACKTRVETGVGIPQLTAIAECAAIARHFGKTVIADGGISSGGDFAKAIVAGADAVMIGGLFAGTEESPGEVHYDGLRQYKVYQGSAGLEAQLSRVQEGTLEHTRQPEGETIKIPYRGEKVFDLINSFLEKLQSTMSYVNTRSIAELQEKRFMTQSRAGYEEGLPKTERSHDF